MLPAGTAQLKGLMLPDSYVRGLRIIAIRALGDEDDAADAVQETLARAVEALREDRVPPDVPLAAFVHGIARHVIADALRRRSRERASSELDCLVATDPSPLEQLVRSDEIARVMRALDRLSRGDRDLLRRCFVHGERVADIARALGQPQERLRKRKSRALARLRERLEDAGPGHVSAEETTLEDDERFDDLRRR